MPPEGSFGAKLKALRESKGLSQSELAKLADVGQQTISQYEAGTRAPTWANVQKLAQAMGVDCTAFADHCPGPNVDLPEDKPLPINRLKGRKKRS